MTIVEALQDPQLFGALPAFRSLDSWSNWVVVLKSVYGLPLDPIEEVVFCRFTGRSRYAPPKNGYQEVVVRVGRQSGKSKVAGLIAAYESIRAGSEDGELYCILVSQDARSAMRTL